VIFIRFNKTMCKVLCQQRLGDERMESNPANQDLGLLVGEKLDMT